MKPQLIFVVGSWGKSMAISAALTALKADNKEVMHDYRGKSLSDGLVTRGGKMYLLKAMFSIDKFPERVLFEVHGDAVIEPGMMKLIYDPYIVITGINDQDMAAAGGVEKYVKSRVPFDLKKTTATMIYNADVPGLGEYLAGFDKVRQVSFSINEQGSDFRAANIKFLTGEQGSSLDRDLQGVRCKIQHSGSTVPLRVVGGIGDAHIYAALSALALGQALESNVVEALAHLKRHQVLPGRMTLIPGIKRTLLIDESYDTGAEAVLKTIEEVGKIKLEEGVKRVAILGEVDGLGSTTEAVHCAIGQELSRNMFDFVVGVGEKAYDILRCAEQAGMDPDSLHHFNDKVEAGKFVQHELRKGDVVLVKGGIAQGFESVVKELMAFPLQAKDDLLVR